MDNYVSRQPRSKRIFRKKQDGPTLRQATIEQLKGVVVLEDIQSKITMLRVKDQKEDILISMLEDLTRKRPSVEVLQTTRIGHTVHKLCHHPNETVAKLSRRIYEDWRKHVILLKTRRNLEVACDLQTQRLRSKARTLLSEHLGSQGAHRLANEIEKKVYEECSRLVSVKYKRTIRKLVLKLKNNDLRTQIETGTCSVIKFIEDHTDRT